MYNYFKQTLGRSHEVYTEVTKLVEVTCFLFHIIRYVGLSYSKSGLIFKTQFGSSLVEAMEGFTDVTKIVEAFGLKTML